MQTPRQMKRNMEHFCTPLKIPPSPFMKSIGYGTGVNVYRLERSPKFGEMRSPWAVKKVSQRARTNGGEVFSERIQQEAIILRKLSHSNIVGFRGVAKSEDGSVDSLALECCNTSLGSILEARYEEEMGPLPAQHTLKMIEDIARALDYLHTEAQILHGDLKSFNVLVKGEFEICKLCDFGVSLPMNKEGLIEFAKDPKLCYVGTSLWSAPEIIDESEVIDCKADIFSFGLIIYETIALAPPHTLVSVESQATENFDANNTVKDTDNSLIESTEITCGTRPPLPQAFDLSDEYNRILELFYICTNELSEDRPMARIIWQTVAQQEVPFSN